MSHDPARKAEGQALLRIARDVREFIHLAPPDDADAQSMRRDADVVERVGRWLVHVVPVAVTQGIPAAGNASQPSFGTCRSMVRRSDLYEQS